MPLHEGHRHDRIENYDRQAFSLKIWCEKHEACRMESDRKTAQKKYFEAKVFLASKVMDAMILP
jgi:hypothetical protein